jgi:hypothetical protein
MVSIEFFHIYTDEVVDKEKLESLQIYRDLIKSFTTPYYSCILIDDYTPKVHYSENIIQTKDSVNRFMLEEGIKLNVMQYESDLSNDCELVLNKIHHKDAKNYRRLIEKNGYLPCSLFVLTWYLLRLGVIKSETIQLPRSEKLVNILPIRYKAVDEIVLKALQRSAFSYIIPSIEGKYFESANSFQPTI